MGRLACVLLLLCVGCYRLPDPIKPPPEPDKTIVAPVVKGTINRIGVEYAKAFRQTCRDAARNLRNGVWTTDRQYRDGHLALVTLAVEAAGQPFADRQQREATPFSPKKMADWLDGIVGEDEP